MQIHENSVPCRLCGKLIKIRKNSNGHPGVDTSTCELCRNICEENRDTNNEREVQEPWIHVICENYDDSSGSQSRSTGSMETYNQEIHHLNYEFSGAFHGDSVGGNQQMDAPYGDLNIRSYDVENDHQDRQAQVTQIFGNGDDIEGLNHQDTSSQISEIYSESDNTCYWSPDCEMVGNSCFIVEPVCGPTHGVVGTDEYTNQASNHERLWDQQSGGASGSSTSWEDESNRMAEYARGNNERVIRLFDEENYAHHPLPREVPSYSEILSHTRRIAMEISESSSCNEFDEQSREMQRRIDEITRLWCQERGMNCQNQADNYFTE
ncbi:hypothetical protein QAD02_009535 [Eretmocerus hayati]|uniref:Uncharacterized protein n=1 Tax=Eretmocerus hayati TaxID=131215 RepID=A0ACC2NBX4_9HYME|nr:hypothetical protein QAD02_009535 [Eretmocerus hayati]